MPDGGRDLIRHALPAALATALGCAVANYYCNLYGDEDEQDGSDTSIAAAPAPGDVGPKPLALPASGVWET